MQTQSASPAAHHPDAAQVCRAFAKRSFATLATTSPAGRPHVAGVLYEMVESTLYISTLRTSRKARNIVTNPYVGVCVPIRRLPVGPPSTVQFQATARVLDVDDPEITSLVDGGKLKSVTSHGELDLADGCFLRIPIGERLLTYGLGMPLRKLIAVPLSGGGIVELDPSS